MTTEIQCILSAVSELNAQQRRELTEALASIDDSPASTPHREQLVKSIRGKYRHVSTSSDAFLRRKEEDRALES